MSRHSGLPLTIAFNAKSRWDDCEMKSKITPLLLLPLIVNALIASAEWKQTPEQFKGTKISIEVGSVKQSRNAPSKEGFIAYEPIAGIKIEKKSTGKTETPTTYGSLTLVYVKKNVAQKFEKDYVASGKAKTTRVGNTDPFNNDANLRWSPPKEISGILWQIEDAWVLVYK